MYVDLRRVANRIASFEDALSEVGRPAGSAEGGSSLEPREGRFAGCSYPNIHKVLFVEFDGTILFIGSDELRCKVLLECKSAKSSNKIQIDGNAHERFSYQNLEYLELAALYPRTQLLLLTNDAFVHYRNKHHTGFGVHGIGLSNAFAWYDFDMVSTASQYVRLFERWHAWLEGK